MPAIGSEYNIKCTIVCTFKPNISSWNNHANSDLIKFKHFNNPSVGNFPPPPDSDIPPNPINLFNLKFQRAVIKLVIIQHNDFKLYLYFSDY